MAKQKTKKFSDTKFGQKVLDKNKKKKAKKMETGGAVSVETQPRKRKVKNQPTDGMIARGCGSVMERRRKATKLR